jgi:organic radical activating enzyme
MRAPIVEVFSSLQGEGLRLGERQIFVRFGACNLECDYCDEKKKPVAMSASELKSAVLAAAGKTVRTISWTGGEPLLFSGFLKEMMLWARRRGFENHLETNGTLPARFRTLAGLVDVVAMDVKLPSATGIRAWGAHRKFLRIAPKKTFVKIVLTEDSRESELRKALEVLAEFPGVPLMLQPSTPGGTSKTVPPKRALAFLGLARSRRENVRLTPQWHPVWGMR